MKSKRSSYGMAAGWWVLRVQFVAVMVAVMTGVSGLCPSRCKCDDEFLRVSCISAGLDVVPIQLNPEIRHINLAGNRVTSLHLSFAFYGSLETLDLSSNLVRTLGSDNFNLQQNLLSLNVSFNSVQTISKNAFHGLNALRVLDLSGNNITEIDEQALRFTSELESLNLSRNSLTSLPDGLLKNLHKIRTLVLNKNPLLEAPANNLVLAPSLENLDLADNLIQELHRDSLSSLPSLISLDLANNVIRSISEDAFDRLPGLLRLDLSGNNLTSVPTAPLSKLTMLSKLILSRNPLGSLQEVAFQNLFELRNLELEKCLIARIHARAFADNINLEQISLDGNTELKELPERILYGARYLKSVSLRRCSLATLQPTQFPVDTLASFQAGGNPLLCNCSIQWLWNVIRSEEHRNESRLKVDSLDIVCADEEFKGKTLISLPESSLRCHLSPLYLSLFASGCLITTAAILALIVYVTKAKRKKQPAYTAPRPELLVYVGQSSELDKNTESYSRRLIAQLEEVGYNSPGKTHWDAQLARPSRDAKDFNLYETPQYARPSVHETSTGVLVRPQRSTAILDPYARQDEAYAVADVTSLQEEAPEVLSLYHMQSSTNRSNFPPVVDYDAPFHYQKQKPHIVFV
ncbi:leucine-rich repeat-containing protein 15-like isoform X1 [Diprion similis]|uniref:leucine-rich repeat-containing protein 15-like isoform X1 n=2 Tax=Diprion similis TaxID=362088 RepID=UPI001EF8BBD6|nr:leucine-rich repeat-containing protein 15-like isoform X1 [Diprion similis]